VITSVLQVLSSPSAITSFFPLIHCCGSHNSAPIAPLYSGRALWLAKIQSRTGERCRVNLIYQS
jgi:hypothetical protein